MDFTIEELRFLDEMIAKMPVTGTMQTLPEALGRMVGLREKIQAMISARTGATDVRLHPEDAQSKS